MNIENDLNEIMNYAHYWNWLPDWNIFNEIYKAFPDSYSILTPFAYAYLEEIIRSTTSEYGIEIFNENGKSKCRKVGMKLLNLAIDENKTSNPELVSLLKNVGSYFDYSKLTDRGDNRNSVDHGYMHSRYWNKDSFENLIRDIALISKHAGF